MIQNYHNINLYSVLSSIAVGIGSYAFYKLVSNWNRNNQIWLKIKYFRESEADIRACIRDKLDKDIPSHWLSISKLSFVELHRRLQSGELKAFEVLLAYQFVALNSAESCNSVAQFVQKSYQLAQELDETSNKLPLHGIPISVEETFKISESHSTGGLPELINAGPSDETDKVIKLFIKLGCVPFVKTNTSSLKLSMISSNEVYGICRNPVDLTRSPGGCGAGEAALMAQKGSPIGISLDSRVSAAWCGSCISIHLGNNRLGSTLDPSLGLVSREVSGLTSLTRQLFNNTKHFPKSAHVIFRDEICSSSKPLRIGYFDNIPQTLETVPACRRAISEAKSILEGRGHELIEFNIPEPSVAWQNMLKLMSADSKVKVDSINTQLTQIPIWLRRYFVLNFYNFYDDFEMDCLSAIKSVDSVENVLELEKFRESYQVKFFEEFSNLNLDAILSPPVPCPAMPLTMSHDVTESIYTGIFNLLDWPSGVIQVSSVQEGDLVKMDSYPDHGFSHSSIKESLDILPTVPSPVGLPLAVQVACPWFGEEQVLRLLREIEETLKMASFA